MDDEEELMDIVAARSRGENREVELRKLEKLKKAQQREGEQSKREEMGFQSSQLHPSTTGDISTGEEIKEEEKQDNTSISKAVQDQIKNHPQDTNETPSAEAGPEDELAFPHPKVTCGQNQSDEATMPPGAYAVAPGTDLQRTTTLGATPSSSVELSVRDDSSDEELRLTSANTRNLSIADNQAPTPTHNINGLVVANQVEENEEPTQIARPDNLHGENKSTYMTRMILVLIGSLLIVGVLVGSICGAGLCSNKKEGDVKTQAPTSVRDFVLEDIQNRIEDALGPDYFPKNNEAEPTQPKFKALDWIVFEDPLQLNLEANNLLQRFIVILTYFQTSRESEWLYCGPSTTANEETCWIPDLYGSESLTIRWLTGVHECQWAGIYCDTEKNITGLWLWDNGLNGPLPTELANIPALESINFEGNQLTGSIPVELFGNKLSSLQFANNSLTGTVPTEVGLFDGTWLGFGSNSLSGSIPTEVFQVGKGYQLDILLDDNMVRQPFHGNGTSVIFNFWSRP
ncbi:receptor-like protein kinase [Seminavis robusta]|uniref:Receptor-like protein kinase n=1 Tax=Seminavis robusta TaxID=568900 RepID=A0A9N8HHY1_9STRA|nr:receptor-like protein kinase [Seminavis robusta]|eukprot:Sro471_g149610.1 receptor-like protein kinase (515) ;mRNA; r:3217-4847